MTDAEIKENLKKFRMQKNPKAPYSVFPDEVLEELLQVKPLTLTMLQGIKGFPKGGARMEKYGPSIVEFFKGGCKVNNMKNF